VSGWVNKFVRGAATYVDSSIVPGRYTRGRDIETCASCLRSASGPSSAESPILLCMIRDNKVARLAYAVGWFIMSAGLNLLVRYNGS